MQKFQGKLTRNSDLNRQLLMICGVYVVLGDYSSGSYQRKQNKKMWMIARSDGHLDLIQSGTSSMFLYRQRHVCEDCQLQMSSAH